jgi:hypothetical protein
LLNIHFPGPIQLPQHLLEFGKDILNSFPKMGAFCDGIVCSCRYGDSLDMDCGNSDRNSRSLRK